MIMALVLVVGAIALGDPSPKMIARVGAVTIERDQVRCHPELLPTDVDAPSRSALCHRMEERALKRLVTIAVLDNAARMYRLEPSAETLRSELPPQSEMAALAMTQDVMAKALIATMQGKSIAEAQRDLLGPAGISPAEFDSFRRRFKSSEQVEQYRKQCTVEAVTKSMTKQKRLELVEKNLRTLILDKAKKSGRPQDDVAEEFWRTLTAPDGIVIMDPSFSSLTFKEILTP